MTAAPDIRIGPPSDDLALPFLIEGTDVRGRFVRAGGVSEDVLTRHADLAEPAARLLGEALVLAALLGSGMKFDGKLIVQARGDGPVRMLVADYRAGGGLRAAATLDADQDPPADSGVATTLGAGYLAITIDQGAHMRRYQGVVPLDGATLSECAMGYFDQSEQIPTWISLAVAREVRPGSGAHWRAAGVMLQHLPQEDSPAERGVARAMSPKDEDDWRRARLLMETARVDEMVDPALGPHDFLWRLYHEEGVRVFDPQPLMRLCTCSVEKVRAILSQFPAEELDGMRDPDGVIRAVCEFCRIEHAFGPQDL